MSADAWVLTVGPLIENEIGFFVQEGIGRAELKRQGKGIHDNPYDLQPLVFQKNHVEKCKVVELVELYEQLKQSELIHDSFVVNRHNLPEPKIIRAKIDALKIELELGS